MRIYAIRHRPDRRRPYEVRWKVGKTVAPSRSFLTHALADSFRAELLSAARAGEGFDVESGLPQRMLTEQRTGPTWFEHAVAYAAKKWPRLSPNSRASTAEALATLTPALVRSQRGTPPAAELRAALYGWAFNAGHDADEQPPPQVRRALAWLAKASVPVAALDEDSDLVTRALDALAVTMDGRPAAANTVRRKRAVFYNALRYAVEKRLLPTNPIDVVQWTLPKTVDAIDRRVVANPTQVRALLAAVEAHSARGGHLKAFYGALYFAALRPAEAVALTKNALTLPAPALHCASCETTTATGTQPDGVCPSCGSTDTLADQDWGELTLTASEPRVGRSWSNSGAVHERRQLKHRARHAVRSVPIPPEYVTMLHAHLAAYGVDADGRLFRSARGRPVQEGEYGRMWAAARRAALTADQVASPLARRPYDLRHAGVSLWLRSGVDATEVARRAGHTVDVLLRVYAGILDGIETESNRRIESALGPGTDRTR